MRVINVVRIKNGLLDNIESFAIYEEQLSDDVVEAAESEFKKQASEIGWTEEELSEDELLEEAYYETEFEQYVSVCLSWSEV